MASSGILGNSVPVSLYTVILQLLSEGFVMEDTSGLMDSWPIRPDGGFLHRGEKWRFPVGLLYKNDSHHTGSSRIGGSVNHLLKIHPVDDQKIGIEWDEDFAKTPKDNVRHTLRSSRAPCSSIPERSDNVAAEYNTGNMRDEIVDKPSSSISQAEIGLEYRSFQHLGTILMISQLSSGTLKEEELLDAMLLLYHLGISPNFRQAFFYMSQQSQSISLLDDTDKQIREK